MRIQTKLYVVPFVLAAAWCFAQSSTIAVTVPDYVVERVGDVDGVVIPGGRLQVGEDGTPVVPYYLKVVPIPEGQRVQSVEMKSRSGVRQQTGLRLPVVQPDAGPASEPVPGQFPKGEFAWTATYEGRPMLYLSVYAVSYDTRTTELTFHRDYEFEVRYVRSDVRIAGVTADRAACEPGDTVILTAFVESRGGVKPAKAVLRVSLQEAPSAEWREASSEVRFEAPDTVELAWPTHGLAAGVYDVEAVVRDAEGSELDRNGTTVRVGIPRGEVTSFEVRPAQFTVGDDVGLELIFENTGSVELSGECVFRIQEAGELVDELLVEMPSTKPGGTRTFKQAWSTDDAEKSVVYTAVGFVRYEGTACLPARATFSTNRMPVAEFAVVPDTVGVGEPVEFDAAASRDADGTIVEYRWEFGDGGDAVGVRSSHKYWQPGEYQVRLTVTDSEGGTGTSVRGVAVPEPSEGDGE